MLKNQKKDTMSLITSILFFIIGILLFSNPGGVVKIITYIIGSIFIIVGIGKIISYYRMNKKMNINNTSDLIMGIVAIVLGLVIIFCSSAIEFVIRLVMGGWILYSGIVKLIYSLKYTSDCFISASVVTAIPELMLTPVETMLPLLINDPM